jgi:hypothetical protein
MSQKRFIAVSLAISALAFSDARAQVFSGTNVCGGGNPYLMCATWSLFVSGNNYRLDLTNNTANVAPDFSRIDKIALGASDGSVFTDIANFSSMPYGWRLAGGAGNPFSGYGLINIVFDATTLNNGAKNAYYLTSGESITFTWTMSGQGSSIDQLALHDLQGSTKACLDADGACPMSTVPEPATIVLVASGLLGLSPFARKRRRKVA